MTRRLAIAVALAALFLATPQTLVGQLPAARVTALFPPGGSPGASVDVAVSGVDLDGAAELRFAAPGITAKAADGEPTQGEAKFTVTVAGDVPPGVYDARVVGRFGISNPRAFLVESQVVAADGKPGTTPAGAAKLATDQAVFARATANGVDFWSFEAKRGQRLLVHCDSRPIDSKLIPDVAILDPAGRELARARRATLLDFTAPTDGVFTLRVSDLLYRGGPEFAYRLCVSTGPHLDAVFPNVARRGGRGTFTLLGRNLPGGEKSPYFAADGRPLDQLRVEIDAPARPAAGQRLEEAGLVGPSGASVDGFAYRLKSDRGVSNAVAVLLADTDVVPEAESVQPQTVRNNKPADAQRLTPPVEVAGRLHPRNDRDCFVVDAKRGDAWVIEVVADRLGQPMAVSMVIQKVAGDGALSDVFASGDDETSTGTAAFRTATRDPQTRFEAKEDGIYQISLRDRFGLSAADPARAYRLSIRKPVPDFRVVAVPLSAAGSDAAVWNPTLRQGGTAAVRVHLVRLDGHTGDVTVAVENLPAGVTCKPVTISAADAAGVLVFSAAADARPWAGAVKVVASGTAGGSDAKREAMVGAVVWGTSPNGQNNDPNRNIDPIVSRFTDGLAIGVCRDGAEPVTVAPADDKVYEVEAGKKLSVPLSVKKSVELKQPLKLKPVGGEAFRNVKELTIEPKQDGGTFELDLGQTKLPPGTYTICLASQAQFKYVRPANEKPAPSPTDADGGKPKEKKKDEGKDVTTTVYSAPVTFTVLPARDKAGPADKK